MIQLVFKLLIVIVYMRNTAGVEAISVKIDPLSSGAELFPELKASECDAADKDLCKAWRPLTHHVVTNPDGSIDLDKTRIGLCALTGVACLKMVQQLGLTPRVL